MLCPQRNKGYSVVDKSRTEWVRYYFHLLWAGLVIRDTKGTPKTDNARGQFAWNFFHSSTLDSFGLKTRIQRDLLRFFR